MNYSLHWDDIDARAHYDHRSLRGQVRQPAEKQIETGLPVAAAR